MSGSKTVRVIGVRCLVGWTFGLAILLGVSPLLAVSPPSFFRDGVPDFDQKNGTLSQGGNNHCGPTAAANSFTWFDKQGYDIVPDTWDDSKPGGNHVGLINQLGNDADTNGDRSHDGHNGTRRDEFVKGLRRYLRGANNNSFHQFDVKFQGSGYRGYTVGSHGNTATLSWMKSEISSGEDVMLHIGWYLETSPGVLSARRGGHVITLDGYTSDNQLLIRDPWFPEGIIEPDPSFPGQNIYVYSTGSDARLRAKIEGITSVSPKPIIWDGLVVPGDYLVSPPNTIPTGQSPFLTTFTDYVSIGLDQVGVQNQVTPSNPSSIAIIDRDTNQGFRLQFDNNNTQVPIELVALNLVGGEPVFTPLGPFDNTDEEFQLISAFGPSGGNPLDHSQVELFVDRDVFGDFAIDSFFDVFTELDLDGPGGLPPEWDHFEFMLTPQALADLLSPDVPDPDPLFAYDPATTDPLLLAAEAAARQAAINSIIPEPGTFVLLVAGMVPLLLLGRRRRRG